MGITNFYKPDKSLLGIRTFVASYACRIIHSDSLPSNIGLLIACLDFTVKDEGFFSLSIIRMSFILQLYMLYFLHRKLELL